MEEVVDIYALLSADDELINYIPSFKYHEIRDDVFADLTPADLTEMGVRSLGHRIKIMWLVKYFGAAKKRKETVTNDPPPKMKNIIADMSERLDFYDSILKRTTDQLSHLRIDLTRYLKHNEYILQNTRQLAHQNSMQDLHQPHNIHGSQTAHSSTQTLNAPLSPHLPTSLSSVSLHNTVRRVPVMRQGQVQSIVITPDQTEAKDYFQLSGHNPEMRRQHHHLKHHDKEHGNKSAENYMSPTDILRRAVPEESVETKKTSVPATPTSADQPVQHPLTPKSGGQNVLTRVFRNLTPSTFYDGPPLKPTRKPSDLSFSEGEDT